MLSLVCAVGSGPVLIRITFTSACGHSYVRTLRSPVTGSSTWQFKKSPLLAIRPEVGYPDLFARYGILRIARHCSQFETLGERHHSLRAAAVTSGKKELP